MSQFSISDAAVEAFVLHQVTRQTDVQRRLYEASLALPEARMLGTPDICALLSLLVQLTAAQNVIEIGTFTGYTALAMALALPDHGCLIACDISQTWTQMGQAAWKEAGVTHKIDLRLAPANQTLEHLLQSGAAGTFDMAFIDADKTGYDGYYEACLRLLRTGGVIAFDNMLWSGKVADLGNQEPDTVALRALNRKISDDPRVDCALLTVGDGVMVVRKRTLDTLLI